MVQCTTGAYTKGRGSAPCELDWYNVQQGRIQGGGAPCKLEWYNVHCTAGAYTGGGECTLRTRMVQCKAGAYTGGGLLLAN